MGSRGARRPEFWLAARKPANSLQSQAVVFGIKLNQYPLSVRGGTFNLQGGPAGTTSSQVTGRSSMYCHKVMHRHSRKAEAMVKASVDIENWASIALAGRFNGRFNTYSVPKGPNEAKESRGKFFRIWTLLPANTILSAIGRVRYEHIAHKVVLTGE